MKARRSHVIKWNRKTIPLDKSVDGAMLTYEQIVSILEQVAGLKKKVVKKKAASKKAIGIKKKPNTKKKS